MFQKLKAQRAGACEITNGYLERNGFEQRLDHRSCADRKSREFPGSTLGLTKRDSSPSRRPTPGLTEPVKSS